MDKQLNLSIFPRLDLFNNKTRMIFFLISASKGWELSETVHLERAF